MDANKTTHRLSGGSGNGCEGWAAGQTIRSNRHQVAQGWPEYVTVVTASTRYYSADGMSYGVGDDAGYAYSATCRAATDAEAALIREQIAANRAKTEELKKQRRGNHADRYDETAANYGKSK